MRKRQKLSDYNQSVALHQRDEDYLDLRVNIRQDNMRKQIEKNEAELALKKAELEKNSREPAFRAVSAQLVILMEQEARLCSSLALGVQCPRSVMHQTR